MARAWSFLTLEDDGRGFVGPAYADETGSHYSFDSEVHSHRHVAAGDLAVIRDSAFVLGIGWIDAVAQSDGHKERLRCPTCSTTAINRRRTMSPTFRCERCSATFDEPASETNEVTRFVADYARSFVAIDGHMPAGRLDAAYVNRSPQHAIRELDLPTVREVLASDVPRGAVYWEDDAGVRPSLGGGFAVRLGRQRVGQQRFREHLLARFGECCAFTGEQPAAALDAAHLYRYSADPEHRPDAGLLLRVDLHRLFDCWHVAVDPQSWLIRVAPSLMRYPHLAALDLTPLQLMPSLRPEAEHLRVHYEFARSGW